MCGQMNFITSQATPKKTSPWMTSVIVRSIACS
jgi:hypothetical protein